MEWRDEIDDCNQSKEQLLADKLTKDIVSLGDTPDIIADNLRKLGCKGLPLEADNCPISKYLVSKGYNYPCVSVDTITIIKLQLSKLKRQPSL